METIKVSSAIEARNRISQCLKKSTTGKLELCPVKDILHMLGNKWSVLVMLKLGTEHTLRFNELKSGVPGISQKMLTVTLKNLEASGLLTRKLYPQIPPRVDYTITKMGEEFLQHLIVMLEWATSNTSRIAKTRKQAAVCQ